MPVNTPHPDFAAHRAAWRKQRLFRDGGDAVKAAGEDYLPRLSGDDDQDYKGFKDRALFYGATGRTLQALSGTVFRKAPTIEFPGDEGLLDMCGKAGESCLELIKRSTEEQLLPGRVGLLVGAPATENGRPYVTVYFAENIVNWASTSVGESEEPNEIVLQEEIEERDDEDHFKVIRKSQFRVLRLGSPGQPDEDPDAELPASPVYYQELWVEAAEVEGQAQAQGDQKTYVLQETVVPRMWGGRLLTRIPFTLMNARNLSLKPEPGPLAELVNVNLSHYISSADLEHGRHFTALPTPVLAGFDANIRMKIGSGVAWVSENPAARAYFLEFSGAGLNHLVDGQKHKEHLMATLGARLLEEPKAGVEAADTMRLRQAGEHSALANVVLTADMGWLRTLQFLAEWRALPPDQVSVSINKDFDIAGMDPGLAANFMLQVQGGLMSYETFFYNQKKADVYPEGWTIEQEREAIAEGRPMAEPTEPLLDEADANPDEDEESNAAPEAAEPDSAEPEVV